MTASRGVPHGKQRRAFQLSLAKAFSQLDEKQDRKLLLASMAEDMARQGPGRDPFRATRFRVFIWRRADRNSRISTLRESKEDKMNNAGQIYDIVFLIGRIIAGSFFLMNGFNHFAKLGMMSGYTRSKGTPLPDSQCGGVGVLLVLGGASLLLGYHPTVGAVLLVIFSLGQFLFHRRFLVVPQA